MKAVIIREHGDLDALRLEELPDPQPRPDEVLLAVKAVGLNHLDTWVRRGVPGHVFPLPMIPGCDFCGVVREVGSAVRGIAVGDRVLAAPGFSCGRCLPCASGDDNLCRHYGIFGETQNGGCAELAAIPAVNAIPIPASLDFVQAASFPLAFLTAWHMLVARCGIRPGDDVLVHAAGSGVGSASVQIGKLFGARVIATAGSERKREQARALGADHAINYETRNWVSEVRDLTGKRGVDIVVEHVGEKTFSGSLRCLAKGGRVVTCGATTGAKLEADLRAIFFKSLSILGSTMGSRGELLRVVELMGRGTLRPVVDRVLPMTEVRAAHEAMARREQFGKIVLTVGDPCVTSFRFDTVAVLGAGTMGRGIAQVAAATGCRVTLLDATAERAAAARANIGAGLEKLVAKGKVPAADAESIMARIATTADRATAVRDADLVVEAAFEDLALKRSIFAGLAREAPPHALLGTNTSSLSITSIAEGSGADDRVIGLHFFNPVPVMALLEIVRGRRTSDATVEAARAFAMRLGKDAILVQDSPGFATSRLGVLLGLEAMRMLQEGVASAADIDKAMELGYRHPMGPLKLTDLVGLDVRLAIAEHLHRELKTETFAPPQILRDLVAAGKLGRKSGQGFYSYEAG